MTDRRNRVARWLCVLLCLPLMAGCAAGSSSDYRDTLATPGTLTIGTSGNYAPYTMMKNGRATGYAIDECVELAKRMGLRPRIKVLDFNALFTALQSGQADVVCSSVTQTAQRKQASGFYLSTPSEVDPTTLLTRADNTSISKVKDAAGASIGGVSGGAQPQVIADHLKGNLKPTTFPGLAEAILALKQGRVEYVAVGRLVGSYFVKQQPGLRLVDDSVNPVPGGLAIAPRPALRDEVNGQIQAMLGDGTITRLQKQWFSATGLPKDYPGASDRKVLPPQALWAPVTENLGMIGQAILLTLGLTVLAQLIATVLGMPLGAWRDRGPPAVRKAIGTFSWLMRGMPALVLLFLVYYGAPTLGWEPSAFTAAVIALSVQATGYNLEIVRGALRSVDVRQFDATRALGVAPWTAWTRVIMPQAVPAMLPPYFSNSIQLLKASSLASVITLQEVTGKINDLIGNTYAAVQLIVTAAVIYLIVASLVVALQTLTERGFRRAQGLVPAGGAR